MRVASEKYGTSVMKKNEILMFIETAIENGSSMAEAYSDMKMIDTCLYMEILQKSVGKLTRKTRSNHYRKNSDLYTSLNSIIEGRVNNLF
jgi:hypothetical protein